MPDQSVPVSTGLDLDATTKRINQAHEWVADLCTGKRRWRMRVPLDASDSDVTISEALNYGEQAVAELRDARAEVERLNDVIAAMDQDDDDRIDDLADARAKLAAVLALHQPTGIFTEWSGTEHAVCCVCGKLPWPCPTVAAVGAVGGE